MLDKLHKLAAKVDSKTLVCKQLNSVVAVNYNSRCETQLSHQEQPFPHDTLTHIHSHTHTKLGRNPSF